MEKEIIIIGGGSSINEGIEKGLWEKIKNKITIGTNYSYRFFNNPTIFCFVDYSFYNNTLNKDFVDNFPLVITKIPNQKDQREEFKKKKNFILFPVSQTYKGTESLKKGIYTDRLVGLFSLTLAISLGFKKIFLLGMDFGCVNGRTHFYENVLSHRGVGMRMTRDGKKRHNTFIYEKNPDEFYKVYLDDIKNRNIKIFNISLRSKIPVFPKVNYNNFFKMIERSKDYSQEEIRKKIRKQIEKELNEDDAKNRSKDRQKAENQN